MSKKGAVRPIVIRRQSATTLVQWLFRDPAPAARLGPVLLPGVGSALARLVVKLYKGAKRNPHSGELIRLWSVTRDEAIAGFCYLSVRFLSPLADDFPPPPSVMRAATALLVTLIDVLRKPGRPRMTHQRAQDWLAKWTSTASSLRWEIGGSVVKTARVRIADVEWVSEELWGLLRENRPNSTRQDADRMAARFVDLLREIARHLPKFSP